MTEGRACAAGTAAGSTESASERQGTAIGSTESASESGGQFSVSDYVGLDREAVPMSRSPFRCQRISDTKRVLEESECKNHSVAGASALRAADRGRFPCHTGAAGDSELSPVEERASATIPSGK